MKKILIFSLILFSSSLLSSVAHAHPGNTDSLGCHTCRTNCSSWGLSYGEYHCHNNKGVAQPISPINSHWGDYGTGYTTPAPDYSFNTPSCPSHATYSYSSATCKCNSGYVADEKGSGCITEDKWCENKYGWHSRFNTLDDACECSYGYVFGKGIFGETECVDGNNYCHDKYGYNSKYNSLDESCECYSGYIFSGGKCIQENASANNYSFLNTDYNNLISGNKCGLNSHSTSSNQCACDTGYVWQDPNDLKNFDCKLKTCSDGYILIEGQCITHTKNCENSFGYYVSGQPGDNNNSSCSCINGYQWNELKTACVKVETQNLINLPENNYDDFINNEKKLTSIDNNLSAKLSGKILLQVEDKGQAWYVSPSDNKRYYMSDGQQAYNIMRNFGIGITNKDLEKIKSDIVFAKKKSGKIYLQIEDKGQAYYIDFDGQSHYLENGQVAFELMRNMGLGIANKDLRKIGIK